MRVATSLAALVLLASCLSSAPPAEPRYFDPLEANGASAAARAPVGAGPVLRVRPVRADPHLKERIVWRRARVELGFHELLRWTQPPAGFVEQALERELFEGRGLRRAVGGPVPTLELHLSGFDEILTPEHVAQVVIGARLTDGRGLALLERTYGAREAVERDRPERVARAMGAALARLVAQIAEDVERTLADPP